MNDHIIAYALFASRSTIIIPSILELMPYNIASINELANRPYLFNCRLKLKVGPSQSTIDVKD